MCIPIVFCNLTLAASNLPLKIANGEKFKLEKQIRQGRLGVDFIFDPGLALIGC